MSIRVGVDPTNPGQYFACCGLLELADRLWPSAKGWFEKREFCVSCGGELAGLVGNLTKAKLAQLDANDNTGSAIRIGEPFQPALRLDWWHDDRAGGKELKVWAGRMESLRIARAMQNAMKDERFLSPELFDVGLLAYDPDDTEKKVEPYYFDSRRGPNAHSRDVGFSPNDLQMTTTAFPAVELLCLVGLQRCLPVKTSKARVFDYYTWTVPMPPELLPPVVAHELTFSDSHGFRFENWYRTGKKMHKAFRSAVPLSPGA